MHDTKGFSLGERQFLQFPLALIGFSLAVTRARQLILPMKRGGPWAQAILGIRRPQELHRAYGEKKEKKTVPEVTDHDALPPKKWAHGTMMSTRFANLSRRCNAARRKSLTDRRIL
jgi:hypothetical protein